MWSDGESFRLVQVGCSTWLFHQEKELRGLEASAKSKTKKTSVTGVVPWAVMGIDFSTFVDSFLVTCAFCTLPTLPRITSIPLEPPKKEH